MTTPLLERAIALASDLPEEEQDEIARIMLDQLDGDARWDALFEATGDKLEILASRAAADYHAGRTSPFPDEFD
jgi:hypothetical protein